MSRKPYNRKDHFYLKAKKEGYVARSAYKIVELSDRFGIFKLGHTVIDLGSAPGGWLQVGSKQLGTKGRIIGIDLLPLHMQIGNNTIFKQADFTDPVSQSWIKAQCPHGVDWVISDMSPNLSGVKFADALASVSLCEQALEFALITLKNGGGFLCKVFPGAELGVLESNIKSRFKKFHHIIPEATRGSSREIYIVGLRLKA
ncbi:MAG: cell division protein FtsJ [uncultured bacterium]|nr:MAG: cell division protein FtsJ [uncultured bacterium]